MSTHRFRRQTRLTLPKGSAPSGRRPPDHDPQGVLRLDYPDHQCADCNEDLLAGQAIVQISGAWWHRTCRDVYRARLRSELDRGGDA